MVQISRTVRFCLNDRVPEQAVRATNGFAGWPPMRGLGRFYQLDVRCRGAVDATTGYFLNIKEIDVAVRRHVIPHLQRVVQDAASDALVPMGSLLRQMVELLRQPLRGTLEQLRLELSPFYSLEIRSQDMTRALIRQMYDFSAAHRLHAAALSPEENQRVFGKCNNPSGHGHNYRLQVAVSVPMSAEGHVLAVERLDALVDEVVLRKLDHKHLNLDVPQFAKLNPSVENIAGVIFAMLQEPVRALDAELDEVSVWETEKTVCTVREPLVAR